MIWAQKSGLSNIRKTTSQGNYWYFGSLTSSIFRILFLSQKSEREWDARVGATAPVYLQKISSQHIINHTLARFKSKSIAQSTAS